MDENYKEPENALKQVQTNMTITPELFEKLYLSPKTPVAGDLRKTFGNPTPIAVIGFLVGLQPIAIALMGWRGSGGLGAATTAGSIWFGGLLLFTAGFLEFILGNSFPSIVFISFAAHFLTTGTATIPWFNAVAAVSTDGTATPGPTFYASYGFYLLSMTMWCFILMLCSIRTNAVFVLVFISVTIGFGLITGGFFQLAEGNVVLAEKLIVGSGGCFFATSMLGWYFLLALMLSIMDLPSPPIFDLSTVIKGQSEKRAAKISPSDSE